MKRHKLILILAANPSEAVTSRVGTFLILGDDKGRVAKQKFLPKTRNLLVALECFLESAKVKLNQLDIIGLAGNSGTFGEARERIIIANALGFALGIPPVALDAPNEFGDAENFLKTVASRVARQKNIVFLKPVYQKEPNITQLPSLLAS